MARPHAALRKATNDEQKQMASLKANDGALARAVARRGERRIHATAWRRSSAIRQVVTTQTYTHIGSTIAHSRFQPMRIRHCKEAVCLRHTNSIYSSLWRGIQMSGNIAPTFCMTLPGRRHGVRRTLRCDDGRAESSTDN